MTTAEPRVAGPGEPGLVSVVIPTFNRAYIVGRAIDSVLQQTYRPIEIVVIDDGSTDDTRQLIGSYGPPVRYVYQPNGGVSSARNHGLRISRGEYVALLDSDDRWFPWKLSVQVELLRRFPDIGMTWTDMSAVGSDDQLLHPKFIRTMYSAHRVIRIEDVCTFGGFLRDFCPGIKSELSASPFYWGDIFSEMILGNLVHTSTVLIKRSRLSKVDGFDELKRSGEDYEFHLQTCYHGPVGFLDQSSIYYRIGDKDQLSNKSYSVEIAVNNLKTVRKWLDKGHGKIKLSRGVIRRHLADCYQWIGSEKYLAGDYWGGRMEHLRSLSWHPWQPRIWLHMSYHFLPGFVRRPIRWLRGRLSSSPNSSAESEIHPV
jgi:glycosyltransferase involved in cell wall biosynthesis